MLGAHHASRRPSEDGHSGRAGLKVGEGERGTSLPRCTRPPDAIQGRSIHCESFCARKCICVSTEMEMRVQQISTGDMLQRTYAPGRR